MRDDGRFFVLDGAPMTRSRHALVRRLAPFLGLLCLSLVGACSSTGAAATKESAGGGLLVTLHNYRSKERFELAGESHTKRVEYYSDPRADAARKIQTDEVMAAFLQELERLGFGAHARTGPAPSVPEGNVIRWGIEVASKTGELHWLVGTGSSPDEWKTFERCRDTFLELYHNTVSYQAVKNTSGRQFFDDKRQASGQKPKS
jgi:hypothetical protein